MLLCSSEAVLFWDLLFVFGVVFCGGFWFLGFLKKNKNLGGREGRQCRVAQ